MRKYINLFKIDLVNILKNPVLLLVNTLFGVILVYLLSYLTKGQYKSSASAYNYYAISLIIYAAFNGAMTATNSFMERDIKLPNMRILHSPYRSWVYCR